MRRRSTAFQHVARSDKASPGSLTEKRVPGNRSGDSAFLRGGVLEIITLAAAFFGYVASLCVLFGTGALAVSLLLVPNMGTSAGKHPKRTAHRTIETDTGPAHLSRRAPATVRQRALAEIPADMKTAETRIAEPRIAQTHIADTAAPTPKTRTASRNQSRKHRARDRSDPFTTALGYAPPRREARAGPFFLFRQ